MRISNRTALALLVFCAVTSQTVGKRGGLTPRQLNLTDAELQRFQQLWAKYNTYEKTEIDFPCGPLVKSPSVPTSVHQLRPGDIKVIGAMGDSLTAGTGIAASNILEDPIQYRGLSWSGGGQSNYEDQITVPNILKKYNPEVYGYATGIGDEDSKRSFFNVAVSGSTSSDLPAQARKLVDRMKADPKVDVANDWKVVTILSGNNDLCDYCWQKETYNVKNFRDSVMAALDILHAELPRTLVNLVEPLNVEILTDLNKGLICSVVHLYTCYCAAFPGSAEAEMKLITEADRYQVAVEEIARSGRYDTREDFTVVCQPFTNQTYLIRTAEGEPDLSYFAPDCFHLSRKGQAAAASALWNNMVEPTGKKRTAWTPGEPIECPTEAEPFFFTNKNSDGTHQELENREAGTRVQRTAETSPTIILSKEEEEEKRGPQASVVAAVVGSCVLVAVAVFIVFVVAIKPRLRRCSYQVV